MPTSALPERVCFDAFEVDLRLGELRKHGIKIKLHPQPFQVLAMLLEHPGELVTREELKSKLWPLDTYVDFDVGLNTAVKKLRDALGDSAETPRYVETLPRRGYRFIGSLNNAAASIAALPSVLPAPVVEERPSTANESDVAESPVAPGKHRRWMLWGTAAVVAGLLVLLAAPVAGGWRERLLTRATPIHIRSIAVLPLENLSGNPEEDSLTDGMTDALITELAQISSLRVISRTSIVRYKGTRKPLPEIAKELNVDGIVEGSVVQSAERVRVDAQLIQAATDRHVWANTYERSLGDAVVLQSEVARAIANAIQVQLTPQEQARLIRTQSVDPQAYEFYLKGSYFWNMKTEDSIRKSIDYFQQAIQREPDYALAYAGMAEAYDSEMFYSQSVFQHVDLSPAEACSRAKAAARRAIQIDESLAEAHSALAWCLFDYDYDWAGAEREFQRAIALNPNYAWAHQWYGLFLNAVGQPQNWAAEVKRARELDPLPLTVVGSGEGVAVANGQYDRAIEIERTSLELEPDNPDAYLWLAKVYNLKGMYPAAIEQAQKAVELTDGAPAALSALGYTYAVSGNRVQALKIVKQLERVSTRRYVAPYNVAVVYAGLGERELAFDWLQKAVDDRSIWVPNLRSARELDKLRPDPRFGELLRGIGLSQ